MDGIRDDFETRKRRQSDRLLHCQLAAVAQWRHRSSAAPRDTITDAEALGRQTQTVLSDVALLAVLLGLEMMRRVQNLVCFLMSERPQSREGKERRSYGMTGCVL